MIRGTAATQCAVDGSGQHRLATDTAKATDTAQATDTAKASDTAKATDTAAAFAPRQRSEIDERMEERMEER